MHVYNNYYNNITGSGINPRMVACPWSETTSSRMRSTRCSHSRRSSANGIYAITTPAAPRTTRASTSAGRPVPAALHARKPRLATTATFPIALPYAYTTYSPDVSRCIALNAAGSGKGLKEAADVLNVCGGGPTNNVYQPRMAPWTQHDPLRVERSGSGEHRPGEIL